MMTTKTVITKRAGETAVVVVTNNSPRVEALIRAICLQATTYLDILGITLTPEELRTVYLTVGEAWYNEEERGVAPKFP